jgi:hypothetical protein
MRCRSNRCLLMFDDQFIIKCGADATKAGEALFEVDKNDMMGIVAQIVTLAPWILYSSSLLS